MYQQLKYTDRTPVYFLMKYPTDKQRVLKKLSSKNLLTLKKLILKQNKPTISIKGKRELLKMCSIKCIKNESFTFLYINI